MDHKLKQFLKAGRADISAVLLIAFLFQLLTPIVVLASERSVDSAFEEALRASICRVLVENSDTDSNQPSHTDGFVCDWCVLCHVDVKTDHDLLPEVVRRHPLAGLPQSLEGMDRGHVISAIAARPSAPRAPPHA